MAKNPLHVTRDDEFRELTSSALSTRSPRVIDGDSLEVAFTHEASPPRPENDRHTAASTEPVMITRGSSFLRYLLVGLDAAALTLSWVIATVITPTDARLPLALLPILALVGSGLVVFSAMGLYRARVCNLRSVEYERLARGCFLIALLALAVAAVASSIVVPREIAVGASLSFVLSTVLRSGYRMWLLNRRRAGLYLRPVLLVGAGSESAGIAALLADHPELGYRTAGVVGDKRDARANGLEGYWRGDLEDELAVLSKADVHGAIICASDLRSSQLNQIVQELLHAGMHVQLSSGLRGIDVGRLRPAPLAHEPLFYVERVTLAFWQRASKRSIDFVLASVMLVVMSPVLVLAAIGIKLQDRGPALFKQCRVGRDGTPFVLYKLRTMRESAEGERAGLLEFNLRDGPLTKLEQDPRVTTFGRILRATSIDELPQLWNVLNGTMSLVGPRPALPDEVAHFDTELRARESVLPGITGLWQVEGRDNPSFAAYRRFDLFYVQNWSVTLDLVILLGTIESVVVRAVSSLLHPENEMQLAPPEVRDPDREARKAVRRDRRDRRTTKAWASAATKKERVGVR